MTINGVQEGIGSMSRRGGGHLNACHGGEGGGGGLEGIIEACPWGRGTT